MVQIIIGCIIAQIVVIAAIWGTAYYLYKKNESKVKALKAEVEETVKSVKGATEAIGKIESTVDEVKNALEKLPFNEK